MKRPQWQIIDFNAPDSLPSPGQDIYFAVAEGEGAPFAAPGRMETDLDTFRDLLHKFPGHLIIWQPVPPAPEPPKDYRVLHEVLCTASNFEKRRCEYCEFSRCLRYDSEGPCQHQKPTRELSTDTGGDDLWQ